jgi:hypothetical protein
MTDIEIRNVNGLKRQREDDENAAKRPRTASEEEQEDEELNRVFDELQALQQKIHEVHHMLQNYDFIDHASYLRVASGRSSDGCRMCCGHSLLASCCTPPPYWGSCQASPHLYFGCPHQM